MNAPPDLGSPGAAPASHPPSGPPGPRRLTRRPDDGHIAGVCAGVAEYFGVDPLIVRIAAVVLAFSGPGVIAYILAWIFVPAEPGLVRHGEPQPPIDRKDRATQIFGIVLLGLGVSVIWGDWWSPLRGWLFPIGLMALGGWLLFRPDRDDPPVPPAPPAPPVPPFPPTPAPWSWSPTATPASTVTEPVTPPTDVDATTEQPTLGEPPEGDPLTDPTLVDPAGVADDSRTSADDTSVQPTTEAGAGQGFGGGGMGPPLTAPWDVPPPPTPGGPVWTPSGEDRGRHDHRPRHRHRHLVGPGVFGVLLIWTGIAWLTGVGLTTGLAVGLVILGIGFVLGSFVGGSRALILPAILVAIALAMVAWIDIPFSGPIGDQYWSPSSRVELNEEYEVSMGEGTLDLSEVGVLSVGKEVRATVGLGSLIVLVPEDQDVSVNTEVGAGSAVVFGEEQDGLGFETHKRYRGDGGTLVLDLEVGMGEIEVRRVASDAELEEPVEPEEPSTSSTLG